MVVIRILVGLIEALLRVLADALSAGIALALILVILGGVALIAIAALSFSGVGTFALFRRREEVVRLRDHRRRPAFSNRGQTASARVTAKRSSESRKLRTGRKHGERSARRLSAVNL